MTVVDFVTCGTWSERDNPPRFLTLRERDIALRFLTFWASDTCLPRILMWKKREKLFMIVFELTKMNSFLSGFSCNLFLNINFLMSLRQSLSVCMD